MDMHDATRANKRFFFFSYPTAPKTWRNRGRFSRLDTHRVRDGTMVLDLCPTLCAQGYSYGGTVPNPPPASKVFPRQQSEFEFTSSDLLVLPTRPPLDDSGRRGMTKSGTALEGCVHDSLRDFFSFLDRNQVTLSERLATVLNSDLEKYASIEFEVYGGGGVSSLCGAGHEVPETNVTVAFLVGCPAIWRGGPRLLAAFGAGGLETLTWGWLLRERLSDLVNHALTTDTNYLVMASFEVPKVNLGPIVHFDMTSLKPAIILENSAS